MLGHHEKCSQKENIKKLPSNEMLKSKYSLKKNKPNNNPIKSGIYLPRNLCLQKKVMKYDLKVSQSSSEK